MSAQLAHVDGRDIRLTSLDRVMYPSAGVTKGAIVDYYELVGEHLIAHLAGRPVTRIRFPHGIGQPSYFQKNAPAEMPEWIPTTAVNGVRYPVFNEVGALIWSAQDNAVELHGPQWRAPRGLDRLIVDLRPGPGSAMDQCCRAALLAADYLLADGLESTAVTTGDSGLQVYAPFPEPLEPWVVINYVRVMAEDLAEAHPDVIGSPLSRSLCEKKVTIDWNQNNPAMNTVVPYSLRGKQMPYAVTPVTWDEVRRGLTESFLFTDTLDRLSQMGDLLAV